MVPVVKSRRLGLLAALLLAASALAAATLARVCFAAQSWPQPPSAAALAAAAAPRALRTPTTDATFHAQETAIGASSDSAAFAGSSASGSLWNTAREVVVAMRNKKSGQMDKSEHWTLRRKFRMHSTMARLCTKKGRKIYMRRLRSGKFRKNLCPGDYINPKMMPLKKLPMGMR